MAAKVWIDTASRRVGGEPRSRPSRVVPVRSGDGSRR
jgi:hypothetical protein